MTADETMEVLEAHEALLAVGFEKALIGYAERFNDVFAIYDRERVIEILVEQGLSHEDAEEYFGFNVVGAWMGSGTPAFVTLIGNRLETAQCA